MECTIDHIVDTLKSMADPESDSKACLLIGAGCSVTAGIPTAQGFVDRIRRKHPYKYGLAEQKTYADCMDRLLPNERRSIISEYVDEAKINWAHVCIAILMHKGFVDRVLTTNFDPLVAKACGLLNEYPAVYDCAASTLFNPALIYDKAIFHLHGQRAGFIMLNTQKEMGNNKKQLAPVFEDAGRGRTWIVVGYSGQNDPVFDHLASVREFGGGLYWVAYKDEDPGSHVRDELLSDESKQAHLVRGYDADSFFVELTRKLDCFPPDLIRKPFTHLECCLGMITEFPEDPRSGKLDALSQTKGWVDECKSNYELAEDLRADLNKLLLEGAYDRVIEQAQGLSADQIESVKQMVGLAYMRRGNTLGDQANQSQGEDADRLFALAIADYEVDAKLEPEDPVVLYNWGITLADWAKTKTGDEQDRLFDQACLKFGDAIKRNPQYYEAFNNLGGTLFERAKAKSNAESADLFKLAGDNYAEALRLKPDYHEALYNWGTILVVWASTLSGIEADEMRIRAGEKFEQASRLKPDDSGVYNNWGNTFFERAKAKSGTQADELFQKAIDKYSEAVKLNPDYYEAHFNLGNSLSEWGNTKTGVEAEDLYSRACERYAESVRIKSDFREAHHNWGNVLFDWAKMKAGAEAATLRAEAEARLDAAERLAEGTEAYNLACLCALGGRPSECRSWLEKGLELRTLPNADEVSEDDDFASVRELDWFREILKQLSKSASGN